MSLPLLVPGPGAVAPPQTTWHVPPMPKVDPAAVRRVASAYAGLEGELRASGAAAQAALGRLPGAWTGAGAAASAHPTAVLAADTDLFCRGLAEAAAALASCAAKLQQAQHAHEWSLSKMLKVGAVVVVSGAAVVVTVGVAAPEVAAADAALIGGEVAGAEVAVASATAAGGEIAVGLTASTRLLAATRGLATFLRPQLSWAVGLTGAEATAEMVRDDRLDARHLAVAFGMDLLLPAAISRARAAVIELPALAGRPVAQVVAGHLAAGYVTATFDAGRQELLTGEVDPHHVLQAGVEGIGLSAAAKNLPRLLAGGDRAGVVVGPGTSPRQTLARAMEDGVDLEAHEGPTLGHALGRHVGKNYAYLQSRLDEEGLERTSSFTNRRVAEEAITETLRRHRARVLDLEAGRRTWLPPLRSTFATPLGEVLERDGSRYLGRTVRVVVRRDEKGGFVLTAMLER